MGRQVLYVLLAVWLAGCSGQLSDEAQSGRAALQSGNVELAISRFRRIADSNPDYVIDSPPLRLSIWTYLGRAYYDAGKFAETRQAVLHALKRDSRDFVARLYLGLTFLRDVSAPTKNDGSLSLNDILYALKERVSSRRVAALIKERGTNFTLSPEVEKELRFNGADDELIAQIRSTLRIPAKAPEGPAQRGVGEVESALKEIQSWQAGIRKSEYGSNWDRRKRISTQVEASLAIISSKRTDRPEFVAGLESLGRNIDEEINLLHRK